MRLGRERLLAIGNLKLSNRLGELSDGLIDKYCAALSAFVDAFPKMESQLKKSASARGGDAVLPLLSELSDTLANIHADDLVRGCEKLRNGFNGGGDKFEADLADFLSAVGALSVDIQMEQNRAEGEAAPGATAPVIRLDRPRAVTLGASVFASGADAAVPAEAAVPAVIDAPVLAPDAQAERAGQRSILAVDDIPVTLSLLKSVLSKEAYRFYGVTSGAAALDFLKERSPDLFILDIEMPKMNGFELAEKIRESGNAAPIVFLTGNTTREYLRRAVRAGASDFIVKPVNAGNVNSKVRKIFWQLDCADRAVRLPETG